VLIAVPNYQGRVSPVFDVATRRVVVRLKGSAEEERREIVILEKQSEEIVRSLAEAGIKVLICGAISQELQLLLEKGGIRVVAHICGEIDAVIAGYGAGALQKAEFLMPGCCGRRWGALRRRGRCRKASRTRGLRLTGG
jgi:predicted Fe-Mo cluster-binding NifX family protein